MAHAIDREGLIAFLLGEYRRELEALTDEELLVYLQALGGVQRLPAGAWHALFTAEGSAATPGPPGAGTLRVAPVNPKSGRPP